MFEVVQPVVYATALSFVQQDKKSPPVFFSNRRRATLYGAPEGTRTHTLKAREPKGDVTSVKVFLVTVLHPKSLPIIQRIATMARTHVTPGPRHPPPPELVLLNA